MANKDFKIKNGLDMPSPLPVAMGGTGQTSTTNSLNALLPSQSGNANKVLSTDGTNTSFITLPVAYARGGTASRPASPAVGDIFYNTDTNVFEQYVSAGWFAIAAPPGVVTAVTATNQGSGRAFNNGQASVAFSAGTNGGVSSSFTLTPSPATSPTTFTGSSSPIIVTGLSSSTSYTYTVSATSPYGTSAASAASAGVTATSVPQAPTIGTATGANVSATVAYTAGATGGAAATYTATSSPGGFTGTGSSPITVSGLTNGTAYTFTVTATNANGTSVASAASNSVTANIQVTNSYVSLATANGTGSSTTATISNIPQNYTHLQLRYWSHDTWAPGAIGSVYSLRINGSTATNYRTYTNFTGVGPGMTFLDSGTGQTSLMHMMFGNSNLPANSGGVGVIDFYNYSNTTYKKGGKFMVANPTDGYYTGNYWNLANGSLQWNDTSAITSLTITADGNFSTNTYFALYGIEG